MKLIKTYTSDSIDQSEKIAAELAAILIEGDVVLLEGTLGSGKTFLVQHMCKSWNIKEDVTSPTFTIIQNYSGDRFVNHFDLYRIEETNELDQLGWEDMIYSKAVSFIEWPQKIEPLLNQYYKILITSNNDERKIELYKK